MRRQIGWTVHREELLEAADTLRVSSRWVVIAARSQVQPDRIRRLETWLLQMGTRDGAEPQFARCSISCDGRRPSAPPFHAGEVLSAELAFYASATLLQALTTPRFRRTLP